MYILIGPVHRGCWRRVVSWGIVSHWIVVNCMSLGDHGLCLTVWLAVESAGLCVVQVVGTGSEMSNLWRRGNWRQRLRSLESIAGRCIWLLLLLNNVVIII
jgi:hypothetical protein